MGDTLGLLALIGTLLGPALEGVGRGGPGVGVPAAAEVREAVRGVKGVPDTLPVITLLLAALLPGLDAGRGVL